MDLQVESYSPTSEVISVIEGAMFIYESRLTALSKISDELSENFTSPEQLQHAVGGSSFNATPATSTSEEQCDHNGS